MKNLKAGDMVFCFADVDTMYRGLFIVLEIDNQSRTYKRIKMVCLRVSETYKKYSGDYSSPPYTVNIDLGSVYGSRLRLLKKINLEKLNFESGENDKILLRAF